MDCSDAMSGLETSQLNAYVVEGNYPFAYRTLMPLWRRASMLAGTEPPRVSDVPSLSALNKRLTLCFLHDFTLLVVQHESLKVLLLDLALQLGISRFHRERRIFGDGKLSRL